MKKIISTIAVIVVLAIIFFYFVPAFRGQIVAEPMIDLGPFSIRWYGIIMALAILLGYSLARKNAWRFGIDRQEIDSLSFWLVIVGLLSARVYYVLLEWNYFLASPAEIIQIWHGGLSIYGGLLGGLGYLWIYTRHKAYRFFQLTDLLALSLPLAQALGRFGNFFNQEAYGAMTKVPWKMYVAKEQAFHHPAFLYELLLNLVVFAISTRLVGRVKAGVITVAYLGLYSLVRFGMEFIRSDSVLAFGLRVNQLVAFVIMLISVIVLVRLIRQKHV